jgi:hypothetical protein
MRGRDAIWRNVLDPVPRDALRLIRQVSIMLPMSNWLVLGCCCKCRSVVRLSSSEFKTQFVIGRHELKVIDTMQRRD